MSVSVKVEWNDRAFRATKKRQALDGIEECAKVHMVTEGKRVCPTRTSTLKGTIGTERDEARRCVYFGCGGAAKAYALRQEMDRSLRHKPGQKAGFIRDSADMHRGKLKDYVQKRVK